MSTANRRKWLLTAMLAVPLAVAGVTYGQALVGADEPRQDGGYICPLTGEELPCPECCPANGT